MEFLARAYQQAQQGNQLAQYGQQYLQMQPYLPQFQAWLQQQQAMQRQQQAAQPQSWWKAPEFDPNWRQKITRDPVTGELKAIPGADPSIVQKYLAAVEHQQGFLDKFAFNPVEAIKPGVEQIARQIAQEMIQQHLGGFQEQTFARGWVEANSSWLHQRDQNNNLVRDVSGRPQLSPYGQRFAQYVQQAEQGGMRDVTRQRDYALGMIQRDYLAAQYQGQAQQQTAQQQGDAAKQQFLQQAAQPQHVPNRGGQTTQGVPNNGSANGVPMRTTRDLASAMMQAMGQNGYQPGQSLIG